MYLHRAFIQGYERMAAWSDLLDSINVFPVADSDTGRNLTISLAPLKHIDTENIDIVNTLMFTACGNSGNLAAAFLSGLLQASTPGELAPAARTGRDRAWQALALPQPGTMLTVLDALVEYLEAHPTPSQGLMLPDLVRRIEQAVLETPFLLPELKDAGVVDAGALGIFTYLEGFFYALYGAGAPLQPLVPRFGNWLRIAPEYNRLRPGIDCVEAVIEHTGGDDGPACLPDDSSSIIYVKHDNTVKVHLHTHDAPAARKALELTGAIRRWSAEPVASVGEQVLTPLPGGWHILSDAAGSLTQQEARRLGITLLDSYIILEKSIRPETAWDSQEIYAALTAGRRVWTSQASVFERHQHYQSLLERYDRLLYLCVGSAFTGNYTDVLKWQQTHDHDNQMTVIDTTAASGRLGLIVRVVMRLMQSGQIVKELLPAIRNIIGTCHEYIFLDRLRYLAAGGRLSKASAFCGDLLHLKPVISPAAEGAKKVAVLRRTDEQAAFALEKLRQSGADVPGTLIMLEYSDNRDRIVQEVLPQFQHYFAQAEILLQPLSLTSGVHTGPGSWGVAFIPGER